MRFHTGMLLLSFCLLWTTANAQEPLSAPGEPSSPYAARVVGDDVYVRSGPDQNYYAVGKASRGQKVEVFGDQYGWLKIKPPPHMYSLIEKNYLDVTPDGRGVVNADHVNIRAAGDMAPQIYARQIKLSRGAEVRILGKREAVLDNKTLTFYKIEPPAGAYLWISADYVERDDGTAEVTKPEPTTDAMQTRLASTDPQLTPSAPTPEHGDASDPQTGMEARTATAQEISEEVARLRRELGKLEKELAPEMAKPFAERHLDSFVERYRPLADQERDIVVHHYARIRIDQIEQQAELLDTVLALRTERQQLDVDRKAFMQERNNIRIEAIPVHRRYEIYGELRVSNVYNSPVLPRRYRLVNPDADPPRTIAYIEIPRDATIDPTLFVGQYVGVIAAERHYHPGLVDPIPIIIPAEISIATKSADADTESDPPSEGG